MNAIAQALIQSLNLQADPVVRMTYVHMATMEELVCGAVDYPHDCHNCHGKGHRRISYYQHNELLHSIVRCHFCDGTGHTRGHVVCYQPDPRKTRTLSLIWSFHGFLEHFRRADNAALTPDLFVDVAHG